MVGNDNLHAAPVMELAAQSSDRRGGIQECRGRDGAETDNELGANNLELSFEEWPTILCFLGRRIAISWRPTAQHVHDVHVFALHLARFDDFGQQLTSFANERFALAIFVRSRGFAEKHQACIRIADSEYRLRS